MHATAEMLVLCGGVMLSLFAGLWLGARAERAQWTFRAETGERPHRVPHHCDGRFYFVMEEGYFLRTYQRRMPAEPPAANPQSETCRR